MPFNLNDFKAAVNQYGGILRDNKWLFSMPQPPPSLANSSAVTGSSSLLNSQNAISFWCEAGTFPAVMMEVSEVRRYGYGVIEKKPFVPKFTDIDLTFRLDGDGMVFNFLHSWMRLVDLYESSNSSGSGTWSSPLGPLPNQHPYELGYKADYAVNIVLEAFNDEGGLGGGGGGGGGTTSNATPAISVTLREAYPIFLGEVNFRWDSRGQYARMPMTLTFFDWYNNNISITASTGGAASGQGPTTGQVTLSGTTRVTNI